jgi:site-specific DNA-methyltransferase (adenine-specific)
MSGLYDLQDGNPYSKPDESREWHPQVRLMDWFIRKKNAGRGRGGGQIADIAEKIESRCDQLEIIEEKLNAGVDKDEKRDLVDGVTEGAYTDESLRDAIQNLNADAKDTAEFGTDALAGLQRLEDNSVACVVSDPPYGVNFESHDDSGTHDYGIEADEYTELMRETFEQLQRVCKDNAHLYIFFATKRFDEITSIAAEFFDVTMTPLIWRKNNGTPTREKGGYEKQYAQYYEPILFCRMPNGRSRSICPEGEQRKNVLEYDRPSGDDRWHDSQKPRPLLRDLITNSTGPSETVLDPFAGSGSTLLAAKASGRHYKGFELSEEPEPKFKKQLREVNE